MNLEIALIVMAAVILLLILAGVHWLGYESGLHDGRQEKCNG